MTIHYSDCKFNPARFNIDFETAEGNAVRTQFPNIRIVSCHFHQKQALFKKLKQLAIPMDQIKKMLAEFNLLTVIPKDEIGWKGIPYVRTQIEPDLCNEDIQKWAKFWEYFDAYWMRQSILDMWNVSEMVDSDV